HRIPARRSAFSDWGPPSGLTSRKSSGFPECETLLACLSSGSLLAPPVAAGRHPLSVRVATGPTAGPTVRRILPDSAHPRLHCPGWPLPSPRPSPSSSADTPYRLMNGPSLHLSG